MDLSRPKGPIGSMKSRAPKLFVPLALFILSCSMVLAQTATAAAPPSGKVVTMPVSEIKAGMKGVAWTVFEGTQPEPMDLTVLGVLKNSNGPKGDMILAQLGMNS